MRSKRQLSRVIDGQFLVGGNHIVGARTYKRASPTWTRSEVRIREILLRAFPRLTTNDRQRESAARWATVIHLYFRMGYTRPQIAHEIGSTTGKIHSLIRSIIRVSNGLRADGTGKLQGKRGRPRK